MNIIQIFHGEIVVCSIKCFEPAIVATNSDIVNFHRRAMSNLSSVFVLCWLLAGATSANFPEEFVSPEPIYSRTAMDHFIQFEEPNIKYGITNVTGCSVLVVGEKCHELAVSVYEAMQRLHEDSKTIIFLVPLRLCNKANLFQDIVEKLTHLRYDTMLLALKIVKGPGSQLKRIAPKQNPYCYQQSIAENEIVMFDEKRGSGQEYTQEMLEKLVEIYREGRARGIMLDTLTVIRGLSKAGPVTNVIPAETLVYLYLNEAVPMDNQHLKLLKPFFEKHKNVVLLWTEKLYRAYYAYNEYLRYNQARSDYQLHLQNRAVLFNFLAARKPQIYLDVNTANGEHYVSNAPYDPNSYVSLKHMLQVVEEDTILVLRYPNEDYNLTKLDRFVGDNMPFIIVNAVEGPGFDPNYDRLQHLDRIGKGLRNVIMVVGFAEIRTRGFDYTEEHIAALNKSLGHPKLAKYSFLGVHLLAENMRNHMSTRQFSHLIDNPRLKYILVSTKDDWWSDQQQVWNFKRNLKDLRREAFLCVDSGVFKRVYVDEEFHETPQTTANTNPPGSNNGTIATEIVRPNRVNPTKEFRQRTTPKATGGSYPVQRTVVLMGVLSAMLLALW